MVAAAARGWPGPGAFALAAGLACGFEAAGSGDTESNDASSSSVGSAASTSTGTTTTTGSGTTAATSESTTTTSTSSATSAGTTDDPSETTTTTGDLPAVGCPETLPADWIFCQDFEQLEDPTQDFEPFFVDMDHFAIDDAEAFSGARSLRIRHSYTGDNWSGEAWVRFGDAGNAGPTFRESEVFDDVWVRLRIRTEDGWPGGGFGEVFSVEALEGQETARVSALVVSVPGTGNAAFAMVRSCIDGAGTLLCDGNQDWQTDTYVDGAAGSTDVASADAGPSWHCLVGHFQLNAPGETDGFAQLLVDGIEDVVLYDLDARGSWTNTGLNTLRLLSAWSGGAPQPSERYIDDVVISTAPLDCD